MIQRPLRRALPLVLVFAALLAHGGEVMNSTRGGTIAVTDGGTASNRTTGFRGYASTETFVVSPLAKITIQCDQDAYVGTDVAGCDAGQCLELTAGTMFPTQVNGSQTLTGHAWNSDGGGAGHAVAYSGGWVAIAPVTGASTAVCKVFARSGLE